MSKEDIPENCSPPGTNGASQEQEQEEFHDGDEKTPLKDPNDVDDTKVGYKPEGASPNDVEMQLKKEKQPFRCLTKEELDQYTTNKKWRTARIVMFVLFWVGWIGMLAAAIIIIVVAPKCPEKPVITWWQTNSMYYIWPRSFKDSDGNGVGDINGIKDSLSYFEGESRTLNIGPVFASPLVDSGYDASDFTAVHEDLGSVADLEGLIKDAHKQGLKVVLDLPPNESSDEHMWFKKSQLKEAPYTDYYVWATTPPAWQTYDGQAMWSLDPVRQEHYLHHVDKTMPDLNYNNPAVVDAMKDVLQAWIDRGVDGFVMRNVQYLVDDPADTTPTEHHNATLDVLGAFKDKLRSNEKGWGNEKLLVVDTGAAALDAALFARYSGAADLVLNRAVKPSASCDGECVREQVAESLAVSGDNWPLWTLGGPDESRLASQAPNTAAVMNIVAALMRGTLRTYYGEEIGMTDLLNIPSDRAQDKNVSSASRDPYRTPMQWSPTPPNAGFSEAAADETYLPVNPTFTFISVDGELSAGAGFSGLEAYRRAVQLRSEKEAFLFGDMEMDVSGDVLVFTRSAKGFPGYMVAANLGTTTVDYRPSDKLGVSGSGSAVFAFPAPPHGDFAPGAAIGMTPLRLHPRSVLVAEYD